MLGIHWSATFCGLSLCILSVANLTLPIRRDPVRHTQAVKRGHLSGRNLLKRDAPLPVSIVSDLTNFYAVGFYRVSVAIGSPPQQIDLLLDTGSSITFALGYGVCTPPQTCVGEITGGIFNPLASTTITTPDLPQFHGRYGGNLSADGTYFNDDFILAGQTIQDLLFSVVNNVTGFTIGLLGIGPSSPGSGHSGYPNIIDQLVSQGIIETRAYSLYLDDLEASTGSIIFGGVDPTKYEGELQILPLQTDVFGTFPVSWTGLSVTSAKTGKKELPSVNWGYIDAILDSGGGFFDVTPDVANEMLSALFDAGVEYYYDTRFEFYTVFCDMSGVQGTLDFSFATADGGTAIISVPFQELAVPYDPGNIQLYDQEGSCRLGISVNEEYGPLVLGDTFLRSAYVLYDIDAQQIGIAQAKHEVSSSELWAIESHSLGSGYTGQVLSSVVGGPVATSNTAVSAAVTSTQSFSTMEFGDGMTTAGTSTSQSSSMTMTSGAASVRTGAASPTTTTRSAAGQAVNSIPKRGLLSLFVMAVAGLMI